MSVSLAGLLGLATDRTGTVYFSLLASKATGIYKVGPGGNLVLISSSAPFDYISLDQASNIYATSYSQLVKLTSGGTEVLSGTGTYSSPDGNQAMGAVLNATAVTVDGSGAVLFADSQCRVREIASDGSLRTIAGTGTCGTAMTGPAIAANLPPIRRTAGSGGSLYMLFENGEVAWTDVNGNLKATSSFERPVWAGGRRVGGYLHNFE